MKRENERANHQARRDEDRAGQSTPTLEEKITVAAESPPMQTALASPTPAPVEAVAKDAARPAAEAAGVAAGFAAPVEIRTPDAAIRWRIVSFGIERTTDGGRTWVAVATGDPASILAGSAPTTTVVWLAGRGGAVLLTTDARTFRRMSAPSTADIVAVSARDDLSAVVRTADGHAFRTEDGGATWTASP